jgi:hypothetical protein
MILTRDNTFTLEKFKDDIEKISMMGSPADTRRDFVLYTGAAGMRGLHKVIIREGVRSEIYVLEHNRKITKETASSWRHTLDERDDGQDLITVLVKYENEK